MSSSTGNIRKKTESIKLYTNQLYYKSYPGKPTTNLIPTAEGNSDFSAKLGGTPHAFYRIYADKDPNQQGMYKSLATGHMSINDVVYKTNFRGHSLKTSGMHTFSASSHDSLKLKIGQEYVFSCEVFVSKRHARSSGLGSVISVKATDQNGKYYGNYDFSKSGTWQVVSIVFTPSLETLVTATSGTSGTSSSAGTSGASSLIKTTLGHTVYFWPQESTTTASERSRGYILYKNPQLEKGSNRSQFTRKGNPRTPAASLKDISSNKNSFSVSGMSFSNESTPIYSKNSFVNLGLTSTKAGLNSSFQVNSTQKKTFDFWFSISSFSDDVSTLFYGDISEGSKFTTQDNVSRKQHIYVDQGKIHSDLYNEFGLLSSSFTTESVVEEGVITNVVVSVDMTKASGKINFYVNGTKRNSKAVSNLATPRNITLLPFLNSTNIIASEDSLRGGFSFTGPVNYNIAGLDVEKDSSTQAFKKGLTVNYKVSSYNDNGESAASVNSKILIDRQNSSVSVSWNSIRDAKGFYLYRSISNTSEYGESSLLLKVLNPFFGKDDIEVINFIDDNSLTLENGSPKSNATYSKYKINNTSFYDGSDMKAAIGQLEGVIYKTSVYSKAFSPSEASYAYIEGSRDFDLTNNTAPYSFSASAGSSIGGYGGGY